MSRKSKSEGVHGSMPSSCRRGCQIASRPSVQCGVSQCPLAPRRSRTVGNQKVSWARYLHPCLDVSVRSSQASPKPLPHSFFLPACCNPQLICMGSSENPVMHQHARGKPRVPTMWFGYVLRYELEPAGTDLAFLVEQRGFQTVGSNTWHPVCNIHEWHDLYHPRVEPTWEVCATLPQAAKALIPIPLSLEHTSLSTPVLASLTRGARPRRRYTCEVLTSSSKLSASESYTESSWCAPTPCPVPQVSIHSKQLPPVQVKLADILIRIDKHVIGFHTIRCVGRTL